MKKLARNGVALAFEESGKGGPPVLLVHGWSCDRMDMEPLFRHFSKKHRTISVDLRGHGDSDKPIQDYSIGEFANDLAWLCSCLGIWKPIVVGHSLGGLVSLELALDHNLPLAVTVLDSPLIPIGDPRPELVTHLEKLRGPEYLERQHEFVMAQLYFELDDTERRRDIRSRISSRPKHVMVSVLENFLKWNRIGEALSCRIPLACIGADNPSAYMAPLIRAESNWWTCQIPQVGHYLQLEAPELVNAAIDRFLTTSVLS